MNEETGEIKTIDELRKEGLIGHDGKPLRPWIELLQDEADMARSVGVSGIKANTPEPHLSKHDFRKKYGCSRFVYFLRRAK